VPTLPSTISEVVDVSLTSSSMSTSDCTQTQMEIGSSVQESPHKHIITDMKQLSV